jgi:hypothetical protein
MKDYISSGAVLDIAIHRKNKDPFSQLHINIGEETEDFGSGHLADLLTESVAALGDQILPQPLHHLDTLCRFSQLTLRRREDAFQPDDDQIP